MTKKQKKYRVNIYSGIIEDSKLEFTTVMVGMPKTIKWLTGFATIEVVKE